MHLFEEETEPTAVTHSLVCKLDHSQSHDNLIVVRGACLLQVYSILHAPAHYTISSECAVLLQQTGLPQKNSATQKKYLKFDFQWPLDGTLTGLGVKSSTGSTLELILSFRYAKMVIMRWNPEMLEFKPQSLHFYEKQIVEDNFRDLNFPAQLLVEPRGKCISLWYQKDSLAILSFPDEDDFEVLGPSGSILLQSSHLEPQCRNIVGLEYLKGYNEPCLGVLYQNELTWTGNLTLHKDPVHFRIISVDVEQHNSTTIFSIDSLPYDVNQIISLTDPIGGTLLLGSNLLVYVEPNGRAVAYAVNEFAAKTTDMVLVDNSDLGLDLAMCKAVQLPNSCHCILALASGDLYDMQFALDGFKVFGITFNKLSGIPQVYSPTSLAVTNDSIFISSDCACAVLLAYVLQNSLAYDEQNELMDEEFEDVYVNQTFTMDLEVSLSDALLSLAPITSLTTVDDPSLIALAFGRDKSSAIATLQKGLWPTKSFETAKFSRFWTAGSFIIGSSRSKIKSFIYGYPSFTEPSGHQFSTGLDTVAVAELPSGNKCKYWQIHTKGMVLYDAKWQRVFSLDLKETELRSAVISGNRALVCSKQEHNLELYQVQSDKAFALEAVGSSNKYYLFEEHIVFANNSDITVCTTHDPKVQKQFSLQNMPLRAHSGPGINEGSDNIPTITEILICRLGDSLSDTLALSVVCGDILTVYEFHSLVKLYTAPSIADMNIFPIHFNGLNGIAAGGSRPFVLLKGHKSSIRLRPIRVNRVLCLRTIEVSGRPITVFVDSRKQLRSLILEDNWDYVEYGWPVSVAHIGSSIISVAYYSTVEVLVVGTNTPTERPPLENEIEKHEDKETNVSSLARCNTFDSSIHILDLQSMKITDSLSLAQETLMCLKSVQLEIAENTNHFKEFIAVGTSILLDEDAVADGHFLIFTISELVSDESTRDKSFKFKQVYKELCAGAVSAVTEVMGKVAAAQGQRLLMRRMQEDHSVEPIAFCDLEIYTNELKSVRNILISGDLYRSVYLINYGDEPNRLDILARDPQYKGGSVAAEAVSSELREDLHIVSSDREGRLRVLQFDPDNIKSMGGPRLVLQSNIYLGATLNCMEMVYGHHEDLGALGGTEHGSLLSVMPVGEQQYRSLFVATQQIMDREPTFACLNTRAHLNMGCQPGETLLLYGPTAKKFWALSRLKQTKYSRQLGRNGCDDILIALSDDPLDYL